MYAVVTKSRKPQVQAGYQAAPLPPAAPLAGPPLATQAVGLGATTDVPVLIYTWEPKQPCITHMQYSIQRSIYIYIYIQAVVLQGPGLQGPVVHPFTTCCADAQTQPRSSFAQSRTWVQRSGCSLLFTSPALRSGSCKPFEPRV